MLIGSDESASLVMSMRSRTDMLTSSHGQTNFLKDKCWSNSVRRGGACSADTGHFAD